ncbi:translin-associated protein X [Thrips palmi]|uniref:Translin-associated protein X n=1 Tax=Thrips palmi TaxID=161013 RepID=A0A6P8ZX21_THRPL|nr:translin-associated protein X [Thrips palmi]
MSHGQRGRRGGGNRPWRPQIGERGKNVVEGLNENSPVIQSFRKFASELDAKHDRHERLVKQSRDVTIESKRIIFLLHSIDKESKREAVLAEAQTRIASLNTTIFKEIAKELQGQDQYQYLRAVSPGIQEYIEAVTFMFYIRDGKLPHWDELQPSLSYGEEGQINLIPIEFFLGVGDLTGELMRCCIQSLGTGSTKSCYEACSFVRDIYIGFMSVGHTGHREFQRKLNVLKQSLTKMEMACYTLAVRGNEMPKHMLADVFSTGEVNDGADEGFCD